MAGWVGAWSSSWWAGSAQLIHVAPVSIPGLYPLPGPTCSCQENVVKECEEEASVPEELAVRARAAGAVSYTSLQVSLSRHLLHWYVCKCTALYAGAQATPVFDLCCTAGDAGRTCWAATTLSCTPPET